MNRQKSKNGRGIEYVDYTHNITGGCLHRCRWKMPDGTIAICYAEHVAHGVARAAYPHGFEYHYWHPQRLWEPKTVRKPGRIFLDSMSDLMGSWVPSEQIQAVLDMCYETDWHTFLILTKNAPRLLEFYFPDNVWVGVSSPPDFMNGKPLSRKQQNHMLARSLGILSEINASIRWMSFEPLSWDVSSRIGWQPSIDWAVIGAASNGRKYYQPKRAHVERLLEVLDGQGVPIFFKGNLKREPWREEFPFQQEVPC